MRKETVQMKKYGKKAKESVKRIGENRKLLELILFAALSIFAVYTFKDSRYFEYVEDFAEDNVLAVIVLLTLLKILAIIWPPFPAIIFIIALMPIIGFWGAFWADYIGELIGSTIAYWISYKYGYKGVALFLDEASIEKLKKVKVKKGKELEFLIILRVLGNTFFEIMCYGAGLLKISFKNFFIATVTSYFIVSYISFKLVEGLYDDKTLYINAILIILLIVFSFKFGSRYIETA